ncbi:MAG: Calx-beta domain-containing protein, partial [Mariprofundaceae bacterium]|nr:Calx-beta domain-containing protein [Mariprofundaceae bacterium]
MNKLKYPQQGMWRCCRLHDFVIVNLLFLILLWGNPAFADEQDQINEKSSIFASALSTEVDDDDDNRDYKNNDDKGHFDSDESRDERLTRITASGTGIADVLPTASVASARVVEGNTGLTQMVFTVSLSGLADGYVDVNYATSDGTSRAATDYTAKSGILTIPPGSTTAIIAVAVNGDTVYESDETLMMTLSAPSANLMLGTASATGTIINDDARHMNDTGIKTWGDSASNSLTVAQLTSPGQDADYGRDTNPVLNSSADGRAGFSFTKLDS